MTTLYLIRHSIRFSNSDILEFKTTQPPLIQSEKSVLSVEGEKRAEVLASVEELQNIDVVYASNCVRTLQTAKYLLKAQNLPVTLDERLDERRFGEPNSDEFPDWFERQYLDENFKTVGGESQKDVRQRMNEAIDEILKENTGKRIAVFSHGYAITFYLMQWYKLLNVDSDQKLTFEYKGNVVYDRKINAPEVFKLTIGDNNNVENIEVIDIDYSEVE